MADLLAYCGLLCNECPAFLATQNNNDKKRAEVAEIWSKEYHVEVKPEDINCDGCMAEGGRLVAYCTQCEIRKCCREMCFKNCASCDEYACEKLENIFKMAPEAKKRLDGIKAR